MSSSVAAEQGAARKCLAYLTLHPQLIKPNLIVPSTRGNHPLMIQTVVCLFSGTDDVGILSGQLLYHWSRSSQLALPGLAAWRRRLYVVAGPHSSGYQRLFQD